MDLTASNIHDARRPSSLLSKTPGSIGQVSADRAYDTGSCYEAVLQHDAIVTILPRRSARCSRDSHPPPWRAMRDTHLRRIRMQGRYEWRKSSGCTRQSVAENAVSRYKAILGVSLSARTVKNQKVEAAIKCAVLNRDGGAWNATIGARVLRRMSFSARFAASANYATTPFEKRCGKWNLHPSFVAGLAVAGSDWHRSSVTQFAASESTDYKAGAECAVLPLPPCPKHIQHGHRSSAGDHGGHHSIPFLHSGSPNLDLPQLQQLRRYLLFLEPQSLGFSLGPGDLLLRFKLHPLQGVLRLEGLLDRSHLCLDGVLEGWRELESR